MLCWNKCVIKAITRRGYWNCCSWIAMIPAVQVVMGQGTGDTILHTMIQLQNIQVIRQTTHCTFSGTVEGGEPKSLPLATVGLQSPTSYSGWGLWPAIGQRHSSPWGEMTCLIWHSRPKLQLAVKYNSFLSRGHGSEIRGSDWWRE